jgi:V/A-type H+-transporting ATPase subunit E
MGFRELIESLRKEGDEKVLGIWREAEDEAGRIRAAVSLRLGAERRQSTAERAGDEMQRRLLQEAETKVRLVRLTSADSLSRRLYTLAVSSLYLLREGQDEDIFEKLVLELPSAEWQRVRVNPADRGIAAKFFPQAHVAADSSITGGMAVETEDGSIRVVNTFEKRLERSWPRLLPELLKDLAPDLVRGGSA